MGGGGMYGDHDDHWGPDPGGVDLSWVDWEDPDSIAMIGDDIDPEHIPPSALKLLSQEQLENIGYFDNQETTFRNDDRNDVADFAADIAEAIPVKKVISNDIQSISSLNTFRDPKAVYL